MTSDGTVAVLAGRAVGGGSTINWMNCVDPPEQVRGEWAAHGLADVVTSVFDDHLRAVLERISATDAASERNGPNERLATGADALGWSWHRTRRNVDPTRHDPAAAGHVGFGDRTGSKQGTAVTYLPDAAAHGDRLLARCTVRRVLVEAGRAVGVEAVLEHPDVPVVAVTVRAPQVVVACGALETPALLLRSGIGGAAVGRHLRLHPVPNLPGYYPAPQRWWWGPPQAVVVDEFRDLTDGYGFLIETPHFHPALSAVTLPWWSGREHKLLVGRSAHSAPFLAVVRDRGGGRVTIDDAGEAVVTYPLDDPLDREHVREAVVAMVRLHEAAGANAIVDLHPRRGIWRRGQDTETFARTIAERSLGAGGRVLFSAHQMGTARMGSDARTSVADPEGQLHDTPGVWIGDTSAFPTAVGSNPMLTCMALARRTAHALLAGT